MGTLPSCRFTRLVVGAIFVQVAFGATLDAMSCGGCGAHSAVWPPEDAEIPVNPRIIIESCGPADLSRSRPILRASDDIVPLRFVERLSSSLFAFEPTLPLQPATRYELQLQQLPDELGFEPTSWTTIDEVDQVAPEWTDEPRVSQRESVMSRDGYGTVTIDLPTQENSDGAAVLVRSRFESASAEEAGEFVLSRYRRAREHPQLQLGVRGCSWELKLNGPGPRSLDLVLLDHAGNRSPERTVRFTIPEPPPPTTGQAVTVLDGFESARFKIEPEYTEIARKVRITGVVSGFLTVVGDGTVQRVDIEQELPLGLTENAMEALLQWRLQPSRESERRVPFSTHFLLVPPLYDPDWHRP